MRGKEVELSRFIKEAGKSRKNLHRVFDAGFYKSYSSSPSALK